MKKLSVKDLVEFRRKSDRGKKAFVERLRSTKIEAPTEGGGDYWISSLSAVCNSYREDKLDYIDEKIDSIQEKLRNTKHTITRNMYQKNIEILQKYKSMDLKKLRPTEALSFLKKSSGNPLLTFKGLQIETKPSHIYTFGKTDENKVGSIWFTAKVKGYRIEEVAMFCEMQYRFLNHNYSKEYELTPEHCVAVDMLSGHVVHYSEIESGRVSRGLSTTLDEINKLM